MGLPYLASGPSAKISKSVGSPDGQRAKKKLSIFLNRPQSSSIVAITTYCTQKLPYHHVSCFSSDAALCVHSAPRPRRPSLPNHAPLLPSHLPPSAYDSNLGSVASFQRRFASDEATKTESAAEAAEAAEAKENFAQTAAEAPVEENLTPAQQQAQADPTNASATVTPDALFTAETTLRTRPRRDTSDAPPGRTLYIGNLYYEVTADQLQRVFSRFGEIENVKIIYDNRGLSRGFGYVEFKNIPDAQTAIDNLDMQVFEGRNLVVQFHREKPGFGKNNRANSTNSPSKTLFIGNMSFEMSDKDLNDLFREVRNVVDVRVAIDRRTGQPRGFAHADFLDIASATHAKNILANKVVYGRELRIDFSHPAIESRDKRADSTQE
ncbi:hypothetical protein LEMA_P028210.1 [Plenodomus lingam JN3]|uniref:RRM domain-containing protein n=1 Tax=Leptosphaeria maculans (strain JN3 / isolate v23.1.3 / race Av1-4-5-6-7-8) TaxID=985895 RepID=E4ZVP3_LEPMJ|nr:hypothetical protein LEMA_P028210.1 [Plenodomus lingam JN3]CBX95669.1 hypothetical protein LEMA_P028210.1 [Plenodomus lingam JN3]